MKKILIAGAVLMLASGSALAADLPVYKAPAAPVVAPVYDWNGFYLGINGGFGWARSTHTDAVTGLATDDFTLNGGLIGGTVGFNWQTSNFVFGIEGDWDWANINGSSIVNCPAGCSTTIRSIGTLRPRVGIAWGNFLPYITGGLAWGLVDAGQPGFNSTNWEWGWTIGAGVEAMLAPNWSAKLEYLYARLNDTSYTVVTPVNVTERDISMVRVGINYHFNWGGVAAKF